MSFKIKCNGCGNKAIIGTNTDLQEKGIIINSSTTSLAAVSLRQVTIMCKNCGNIVDK